ncbi:hypothetical protein RhiirA5_437619 [Rhizophagus irregularis]|uniref:Uncharacterized protein n=1 Tax=Rhizophagus irregularis TaxID=588596 RepID=A0A2N0NK91_9GLOM|nr:hypothetical protein RhiirA5_437619 [Rhizophagus irregularis]
MQCKKKEETLRRSLKRGQKEINTILCEEEGNSNSQNIRFGIQIESNGKVLSPKDTQVLMLKNLEYKQEIYSQNKTIKKLKNKITSINNDAENTIETNITTLNDAEIRKSVEKEMEERQLGSVIFMSTSQYLSILLSLPCPNCLDLIASNRTFYTRVSGFNIYCVITCLLCKTSTQYSNEDSGMKYSQVVAGAALAGGVNRNSFQTALATIGVTNQCCKKSYFNCQARMYKPIIDSAKSSCKAILYEILDHLELAHLPSQEKVLLIGFDCSWSHSRNAHQASGEFLYLGDLPGYNYQPVIGFHMIENPRTIRKSNNDFSKIVYKGNFDGTAGLKNKLNQDDAPTEVKTRYIQVEGLIRHLLDDHSMCWSDVCWIKDNPELQLQSPTLKNYTQADIENFRNKLVSYKSKAPEQIRKDLFWPLFGELLRDFDVIVKYVALWERIVNDKYIPKRLQPELPGIDKLILLAAKKIFGFENF